MSLLLPATTKFRKDRKGRKGKIRGMSFSGSILDKGSFGIKVIESGRINNRQIESARKVISKAIKKVGKMFIRVFPNKSLTKKPGEVRMGKGKGNPEHWVVLARPGLILFEIEGVKKELAQDVLRLAGDKLSVRTIFVEKEV